LADDDSDLLEGGPTVTRTLREKTYSSARPKRKFRTFRKPSVSKSFDVSHDWMSEGGAWRRWGDDKNNFQLGSYGGAISSGYSREDGGHRLDVIKASIHGEAASANAGKDWKYGAVEASGKALAAEAEASVGAEWSKKAKDIHAKVGGSVDLVKGEIGGKIKIPLFGHTLALGLSAEGQVGASAEANASLGWSEKDGFSMGAKAKAGFGLGGGISFSLGFK